MLDAAADLLLGSRCAGCERPGRVLCGDCASALPDGARPAWPTPVPPGLVEPWAAAPYEGLVRSLVLGHKERRLLGLRGPLGGLLAGAAQAAAASRAPTGPVVLVPVPSRPVTVRARGHDPTYAMTATAARLLSRGGQDVVALKMLHTRPGLVDQAGLDAEARAANLAGSMACPAAALRRLRRRRTAASVIVCDDVLTTGATAREAQRALGEVGLHVVAVAAVAATRRRLSRSCADLDAPTLDPPWSTD